jgi:hypothetical protein
MEKQNEMKGRLPVLEFYNNLAKTVQEFLNNLCGLGTELEQGCRTGPPGSFKSILGLLKSLKIRALSSNWAVVLARQAILILYIGWRNRFLGSLKVLKLRSQSSSFCVYLTFNSMKDLLVILC